MKFALRGIAIAALALMAWPEFGRYRAEWMLADANSRLQLVLRGERHGAEAVQAAMEASALSEQASSWLPEDPRAPLLQSIALILLGRGKVAIDVLDQAIAQGERPELTINLGRARSTLGDARGASAAYLRTAWASPAAISSLPMAMQSELLVEVGKLESELRAGRLSSLPPL